MGTLRSRKILTAALAAAAVSHAPADAQCRLCTNPTTSRGEPNAKDEVRLEIETSLNFDRLILIGGGEGSALIRPDGSSSAEGAVASVGTRAMVGTAVVHGQPNRTVRVDLPRRIELYSLGGGRVSVDELASDLPALPRLDSTGRLTFRFGGRVRAGSNVDGDYRGDLPITVDYQ
jgi:hypothetical protein